MWRPPPYIPLQKDSFFLQQAQHQRSRPYLSLATWTCRQHRGLARMVEPRTLIANVVSGSSSNRYSDSGLRTHSCACVVIPRNLVARRWRKVLKNMFWWFYSGWCWPRQLLNQHTAAFSTLLTPWGKYTVLTLILTRTHLSFTLLPPCPSWVYTVYPLKNFQLHKHMLLSWMTLMSLRSLLPMRIVTYR